MNVESKAYDSQPPELLIVCCTDPGMWYAKLVGTRVPCISTEFPQMPAYTSREPSGHLNLVYWKDACLCYPGDGMTLAMHLDDSKAREKKKEKDETFNPHALATSVMTAVMAAYVHGSAVIKRRKTRDEEWKDDPYPTWNWKRNVYRVKPEIAFEESANG